MRWELQRFGSVRTRGAAEAGAEWKRSGYRSAVQKRSSIPGSQNTFVPRAEVCVPGSGFSSKEGGRVASEASLLRKRTVEGLQTSKCNLLVLQDKPGPATKVSFQDFCGLSKGFFFLRSITGLFPRSD